MIRLITAMFLYLVLVVWAFAQTPAPVKLAWTHSTDNVAVTGYNIYRDGKKIGSSPTTSYTDTTVAPTTQYSYTVSAFDAAGNESDTSAAYVIKTGTIIILPGDTDRTFTPTALRFISPTGSDGANGLTPATAWATPNHSVNCGDVILVAAGAYNSGQFGSTTTPSFGVVSNCPSTTGGVDGTGGIYFAVLLCAGVDTMSCTVNGGAGPAFETQNRSNWSVQGFWATMNTNGDRGCYSSLSTANPAFIAWVNNIASTCDLDAVGAVGQPSTAGPDMIAVVGNIGFNAANSLGPFAVCGSGISMIPANGANTGSGTHVYVGGNILWKNTNAPGATECQPAGPPPNSHTDGNGIIFDANANQTYQYQVVAENNAVWLSGGSCIQVYPQGNLTTDDQSQHFFQNNTCYGSGQDTSGHGGAELFLNGIYPGTTGSYSATNNIFLATLTTTGTFEVWPVQMWANTAHVIVLDAAKINIANNWIWQSHAPTSNVVGPPNTNIVDNIPSSGQAVCTPPFSPPCFDAPWHFGTNTYNDPGLTSPGTLITTAPDCTGFDNVVRCMNDGFGVYTKLKPTIAPTTMGYQPPGPCVGSNPFYPTWLKGIVYLRTNGFVSGAIITQKVGLITKPCGS